MQLGYIAVSQERPSWKQNLKTFLHQCPGLVDSDEWGSVWGLWRPRWSQYNAVALHVPVFISLIPFSQVICRASARPVWQVAFPSTPLAANHLTPLIDRNEIIFWAWLMIRRRNPPTMLVGSVLNGPNRKRHASHCAFPKRGFYTQNGKQIVIFYNKPDNAAMHVQRWLCM